MDLKDVLKLMDRLEESNITYVLVEEDGKKIELKKEAALVEQVVSQVSVPAPVAVSSAAPVVVEASVTPEAPENGDFAYVTSPIVGTFYASPSPTASPFVKVGETVKKGQVLCIVEAMKLMNEIESEYAGEVVEILVENESMVEFGQKLFKVRVK